MLNGEGSQIKHTASLCPFTKLINCTSTRLAFLLCSEINHVIINNKSFKTWFNDAMAIFFVQESQDYLLE